ncbi:MAG: hypothetical protein V2G41_09510 [bacterium JZ-2024 1]
MVVKRPTPWAQGLINIEPGSGYGHLPDVFDVLSAIRVEICVLDSILMEYERWYEKLLIVCKNNLGTPEQWPHSYWSEPFGGRDSVMVFIRYEVEVGIYDLCPLWLRTLKAIGGAILPEISLVHSGQLKGALYEALALMVEFLRKESVCI